MVFVHGTVRADIVYPTDTRYRVDHLWITHQDTQHEHGRAKSEIEGTSPGIA